MDFDLYKIPKFKHKCFGSAPGGKICLYKRAGVIHISYRLIFFDIFIIICYVK